MGRPELAPFLVGQRPKAVPGAWRSAHPGAIAQARVFYDEGLVEIVGGEDGNLRLLYSIPRKERAAEGGANGPRRHYFQDVPKLVRVE